jgi:short-subunit dehydrogenase
MKRKAIIIFGATSEIGITILLDLLKECDLIYAFGRNNSIIKAFNNNKFVQFEKFPETISNIYLINTFKNISSNYLIVSFIYLIGVNYPKPLINFKDKEISNLLFANVHLMILSIRNLLQILNRNKIKNPCKIIVVSSTAGIYGYNNSSVYAATKHAMIGFIKSLKIEYSNSLISFHAICPGLLKSKSLIRNVKYQSQFTDESSISIFKKLINNKPLKSWKNVNDISNTIRNIVTGKVKKNIVILT